MFGIFNRKSQATSKKEQKIDILVMEQAKVREAYNACCEVFGIANDESTLFWSSWQKIVESIQSAGADVMPHSHADEVGNLYSLCLENKVINIPKVQVLMRLFYAAAAHVPNILEVLSVQPVLGALVSKNFKQANIGKDNDLRLAFGKIKNTYDEKAKKGRTALAKVATQKAKAQEVDDFLLDLLHFLYNEYTQVYKMPGIYSMRVFFHARRKTNLTVYNLVKSEIGYNNLVNQALIAFDRQPLWSLDDAAVENLIGEDMTTKSSSSSSALNNTNNDLSYETEKEESSEPAALSAAIDQNHAIDKAIDEAMLNNWKSTSGPENIRKDRRSFFIDLCEYRNDICKAIDDLPGNDELVTSLRQHCKETLRACITQEVMLPHRLNIVIGIMLYSWIWQLQLAELDASRYEGLRAVVAIDVVRGGGFLLPSTTDLRNFTKVLSEEEMASKKKVKEQRLRVCCEGALGERLRAMAPAESLSVKQFVDLFSPKNEVEKGVATRNMFNNSSSGVKASCVVPLERKLG